MTSSQLETYLRRLERELRKRGLLDERILEEARGHLADALDHGLQRGLSLDAAESEALARFGAPEAVAAKFAAERYRLLTRLVRRVLALAFRDFLPREIPERGMFEKLPDELHVHDFAPGPSSHRISFRTRPKRWVRNRLRRLSPDEQKQLIVSMKERGMAVSAVAAGVANGTLDHAVIAADAREQLVQFLGHFGPRMLGPRGTVESLTLVEATFDSTKYVGRYLAAFAGGAEMIWTVVHASDGSISLDGINATKPQEPQKP